MFTLCLDLGTKAARLVFQKTSRFVLLYQFWSPDVDGSASCAACLFMMLQNALNSPQLAWKWMEMSAGVLRNTEWCDLNCSRLFNGLAGCNHLHLFMGQSANKHVTWRWYDTFGPDVNLQQTFAANIYILENESHHLLVLSFTFYMFHVKTKERRGKE